MKILILLPLLAVFMVKADNEPVTAENAYLYHSGFVHLYHALDSYESQARQLLSPTVNISSCSGTMNREEFITALKTYEKPNLSILFSSVSNVVIDSEKLEYSAGQYICLHPKKMELAPTDLKVTALKKNGEWVIERIEEINCSTSKC